MRQRNYDNVNSSEIPTWNYTKAEEPISRKKPEPQVPSNPLLHRYLLILITAAASLTLLALMHAGRVPLDVIFCAGFLGWLFGQLWPWQPPH